VLVLTPTDVRTLLDTFELRPSRALGQNFLADPNIARRIARLADVESGDAVLEIGPGLGSLTLALAERGAHVRALELDRHVMRALEHVVADVPGISLQRGDALTYDYATELEARPWICVSNLPYNVATPIIIRLLESAPQVHRIVVMIQREVGIRLAAAPGTHDCGAVSAKIAYHSTARIVATVPSTVFVPRPKVESVVVRLDRRSRPAVDVASPSALFALVAAGFSGRRKMLRRSLRPMLGDETEPALVAAGIDPTARGESLDLAAWARLTEVTTR
jgi:16S rRNA (adenine1518-N6/adenine1519-N6)-dimethyltransferase